MLFKIIWLKCKANCFSCLLLLFLLFFCSQANAQCAGEDAQVSICDIANPANQSINLFNLLGGTPTPGGTWIDLQQSGGLDIATGILNVSLINESDIYEFVYVVNNSSCTDDRSTVIVTIGGHAGIGVINPPASACDDNSAVNLFQFIGGFPNPQINGLWEQLTGPTALNGNIFNAAAVGIGNYRFRYYFPPIGNCPMSETFINLTVYPAPKPGITQDLILCETADFSLYTNLNLLDYITGQDPNGRWTESGTSELSGPFDTFINVQNIYNTFGPGEYNFTYTVLPSHPVCTRQTSTITIVIENQLDFTNSTLVVASDICENQIGTAVYTATLTQGVEAIPNGNYEIDYQITGAFNSTRSIIAAFNNGTLTFSIPRTLFPVVGTYTIKILNIHETGGYDACDHILDDISHVLTIFPIPRINSGTLTIGPACQNTDVAATISGNTNLPDGNYEITYSLSGSNTVNNQIAIFSVTSGTGTFIIPGNFLPNIGNTTIRISFIENTDTGCENTATLTRQFVISPKPETANVGISINDFCENEAVNVSITGLGSLSSVIINYTLSGGNSASQTVTVTISGGNASFIIPASILPNLGTTTLTITEITNSTTLCGTSGLSISDSFLIKQVPLAPIASDLEFCSTQNATVADLLPNGPQYIWYNSATGNNPLNGSTRLQSGNYWVALLGNATICTSLRAQISVTITEIPTPTLETDGEKFCGLDVPSPTLAELTANVSFTENLIWFDAASGGNQLPNTQILQDGTTYYAFDTTNSGNCSSGNSLAVTVSLSDCDSEVALMIPDGFSPNGDGVNDTFHIPDIEFLFPNFTLEIFNRYGNVMYKGNRNTPDWDGKSNQSGATISGMAPNGVYFYIVNFNKDGKSSKQGRLYLNR